jgi:hypothetical protein
LILVIIDAGDRFQVFCFENLITVQTANVVYSIAPRHDLGTGMLAVLHIGKDYPYSKRTEILVKPLF